MLNVLGPLQSAFMLSFVVLGVMLNVFMMSVIMLGIAILSAVRLRVMAPLGVHSQTSYVHLYDRWTLHQCGRNVSSKIESVKANFNVIMIVNLPQKFFDNSQKMLSRTVDKNVLIVSVTIVQFCLEFEQISMSRLFNLIKLALFIPSITFFK